MAEEVSARQLTFWGHIGVLRNYFLGGGILFVVFASLAFSYYDGVLIRFFLAPLHGEHLLFLSPLGPFLFKINIALYAAFAAAFPFWLGLVLHFVSPALKPGSRYMLIGFCVGSVLLGAGSIALAGFYFVPVTLHVLQSFAVPGTDSLLTAESYLSFFLLELAVVFLILQIPIVLSALSYARVINPNTLARYRRLAIVAIVTTLAIVTPTTDVVTLIVVSIPAILLWEVGIVVSRMIYNRKQ